MGKKQENTAQVMFDELLNEEIKGAKDLLADDEPTNGEGFELPEEPQNTKTQAPKAPPKVASKRAKHSKQGFQDLDPLLQEMLVHPEESLVQVSNEQELESSFEESSPSHDPAEELGGELGKELDEKSINELKSDSDIEDLFMPEESDEEGENTGATDLDAQKKDIVAKLSPTPPDADLELNEPEERNFEKTQKIQTAKISDETMQSASESFSSPSSMSSSSLEEQLRSANYLELAQNRVLELEKEVQKLRRDNEQLASAGQHFKELTESIKQQLRQSEANFSNLKEIAEEEKRILTQSLEAKEIKIGALQERLIELEEKINSSFDHVRIRERELENRLEIMKTESEAVTSSKDEMILDLKKQLSLVNSDLEKYRIQNQKITSKMENKEELLRRTVKALRIALTMLEGSRPEED